MMRRLVLACLCVVASALHAQQYMRVWSGGDYDQIMLADAGSMPVSDGASITIGDRIYPTAAIDSITFGARIHVAYSGTTAEVTIPQMMANSVSAQVSGADVTITNTNVAEELEFVLSGTSQAGSFTYNGQYKATFILNGLNLTSTSTAAVNIQCGKRIDLKLAEGTDNMLEDCASGSQKAALYCKGHLELSGAGTLTVKGNSAHGIGTKEYLVVKKSVRLLAVTGAVKDGIHVGQYYQQNGGIVTIAGNKGDALQVEAITLDDGTPDPSKEFNGECFLRGGSLTAAATGDDTVVLKVDADIAITGGTLDFRATGAGSRCIKTDGSMTVNQSDATTSITLYADGEKYYEGEDSSRCRLGKVNGDLHFDAGTMTGNISSSYSGKARGFKVDGTLYWNKSAGATYSNMGWEAAKIEVL